MFGLSFLLFSVQIVSIAKSSDVLPCLADYGIVVRQVVDFSSGFWSIKLNDERVSIRSKLVIFDLSPLPYTNSPMGCVPYVEAIWQLGNSTEVEKSEFSMEVVIPVLNDDLIVTEKSLTVPNTSDIPDRVQALGELRNACFYRDYRNLVVNGFYAKAKIRECVYRLDLFNLDSCWLHDSLGHYVQMFCAIVDFRTNFDSNQV